MKKQKESNIQKVAVNRKKAEGRKEPIILSAIQSVDPIIHQPVKYVDEESLKIIHEFEKYQIELELQNKKLRLENEELVQAKNKVEIASKKYKELYDSAPSGNLTLSKEGIITELNLYGAKMLGKKRSRLINSELSFFISDDTKPIFNRFLDNVFITNENEICEVTLSTNDVSPLSVYLTGIVTRNREYCHITMVDINSEKRAVNTLRESEERFRAVTQSATDAIITINAKGIIAGWNKGAEKIFGFMEDEIAGKDLAIIIPKHFAEHHGENIERVVKGGDHHVIGKTVELQGLRRNGDEFPIELSLAEWKTASGKFFTGIIRDITERKRVEKQLLLLSRAIEESPVSVIITDKKGNIEYANPKFTAITGFTFEEVRGKNSNILQSGRQSKEFYKELWNAILSGKDWQGEFHNKKKNGESYYERTLISPIVNSKGDISYFVAIKEDITEKKMMISDLLKAKEKASESDNLKVAFLNNISHEIRTPFNGILGFLSILQYDDLTNIERNEYTTIINNSANRLLNTLNNIIEISQIQAGQSKLISAEINIKSLANEIYNHFVTEAEYKGIQLKLNNNLSSDIEVIYSDYSKLNTILSNLVGNAIKFTKTGSVELGIRYRNREGLDFTESRFPTIEFSVKDTGIGIHPQKQQAIFEPFMQVDTSNTRQFEGSGLGLSISRAYIELLNGKIWVESEIGKGSIFHFTVPYLVDKEEKNLIPNTMPAEVIKDKINSLKILIAEDDEPSSYLLKMVIKPFCKEVIIVKSGVEAVESCRKDPDIDLVLMDIKMPDMNGYEATRRIRQFNSKIVIIAQTAYALSGDKEHAMEAGCNDYISKPIKREQIKGLVQKNFSNVKIN